MHSGISTYCDQLLTTKDKHRDRHLDKRYRLKGSKIRVEYHGRQSLKNDNKRMRRRRRRKTRGRRRWKVKYSQNIKRKEDKEKDKYEEWKLYYEKEDYKENDWWLKKANLRLFTYTIASSAAFWTSVPQRKRPANVEQALTGRYISGPPAVSFSSSVCTIPCKVFTRLWRVIN